MVLAGRGAAMTDGHVSVRNGASVRLEVHRHTFVSGPRSRGMFIPKTHRTTSDCSHSHAGGSEPHQHPDTGPATYVIDRDEWARATRFCGGGRKTYTARPIGEQMPRVELDEWQKSFEVIICDPPKEYRGEGPGIALAERLVQQFRMTYTVTDKRSRA